MTDEHQIPQDLTSEKALLCSLISNPALLSEIPVSIFWMAGHRIIYEAVERLAKNPKVKELDFPVLKTDLTSHSMLEDAGGVEYLNEIWDFVPSPAAWAYYREKLDLVRRHREAVLGAHEIQRAGSAEEALAALENLAKGAQFVPGSMRHISEVLKGLPDYLENKLSKRSSVIRFGIPGLDSLLWVAPGTQIVICAETGGGKTSLAAQAVGASETKRWAIFTLEMEAEAIMARLASNVGSIALHRLYRGNLDATEWKLL